MVDHFSGTKKTTDMRRILVEFSRRVCLNAAIARPIAAIDGAINGGARSCSGVLRESNVVVTVISRSTCSGGLKNGFSAWSIGCRQSGIGGSQLRLFSSGLSDAESGALVSEEKFHSLANDTLDTLQEKIEAYGEDLDVDGFDLDYSDGVMTVRLGDKGTYVLNKQTPNRQLWLSSPVSGPARFDWNMSENLWIYRRTKAELISLLEEELSELLGSPVALKN